jgi:hypothetical protein
MISFHYGTLTIEFAATAQRGNVPILGAANYNLKTSDEADSSGEDP